MTSKIAKCERIFSDGESSVKLEIDYQTKRYSVSPLDYGCGEPMFHYLSAGTIQKDLTMVDLIRQAIEFAEKELKGEGEKDKLKEPERRKIEMTMCELREGTQGYAFQYHVPDSAKVTFEWTE